MRASHPTAGRANLRDLARSLGVSPATISNAYHHPERLSAELRAKVLQAADRLGYHPNPTARGLRMRTTGTVGVLYKDALAFAFTDPAFSMFLQGVAEVIQGPGLRLLLLSGDNPPGHAAELRNAAVDGVVWYAPAQHDPRITQLIQRHLPAVLVDADAVPGLPVVTIDDEAGADALAAHLFELGHRRVAVLGMPCGLDNPSGPVRLLDLERSEFRAIRARCAGYAAAARRCGVPWGEAVPAWATSANSVDQGRLAGRALLGAPRPPTAILCLSDQLALGVLAAARELRVRVPEDVSVVGFDDIPESARTTPPLTTVRQAHDDKGRTATALLLDQLAGKKVPSRKLLRTRLVVRSSSAAPAMGSAARRGR
jgi:DNA-binding LacI/PurR family transcriptional regulator